MSLKIIYGRSGSGKTHYILNCIAENINNGKKKFIITPEQFSFTAEKELLNHIKDKTSSSAVIAAEVLTFERMAHRVANEVGGITKTILSDSGKAMLLYSILADKKSSLKFLGKSDNNIELIMRQISELKKHGVSLENLSELINRVDDRYLTEKLNDIYNIYDKYEEKIAQQYIDENDDLTRLILQLDDTNMFDDSEIYIDEFAGFTKQEYLIIEKLMKVANKLIITICADDINKIEDPNIDIFYSNKKTINNIIEIAKQSKVAIEEKVHLSSNKRFKNIELIHIEDNIFSNHYKIYSDNIKNINLFLANNQYSEIENVAKNIINLVRDEKYMYKDISIIAQDIELYSNLCKSIFDQYHIPIYVDTKKELNDNILVKYIISILDIFAKNWSNDSVISYLKTGFTTIDDNDSFLLEKYAKKWNIRGNKWYKGDWDFHDETEFGKENLEKINTLREELIKPLLKLKDALTGIKTARQISQNLYNFLIENQIDKKLKILIQSLENNGELNIAAQYETSWKIIMNVLDEIIMVFGDDRITFDNYVQVIRTGFNYSDLGTIPMTQDEVIIGDVNRSRNHKVRALFIIGANDGNFPTFNKTEGFLNDDDRENVKKYGIELAKGTLEQIYDENFNIYKAFTTAEEKLFLSYASSSLDGKSLRVSNIINKIKKIFPKLKEESDIIKSKTYISVKAGIFNELLENLRMTKDDEKIDPVWFNIYKVFREDDEWSVKLEKAIEAINFGKKIEFISKENIDKMYGSSLKTSVSKLEQYRKCPFSYFIKYGLKLNERDIFKIEAMDTGSFMHDVIDAFFTYTEENEIKIRDINDEQIEYIVSKIVSEKLKLNKNYMFSINERYRNLTNRLKKVIITSMKYIIQGIKQSNFNIYGHEVEFGENKKYKPIKILTSSGKTAEIIGKIDRIDIAKNRDGTYVRIIDYKSSIKSIDLNKVVAGLQIQLLTYLNETCRVEDFLPAGALYFDLTNPTVPNAENMTEEQIENEIKRQFRMTGLVLADVNVIKMMDNNLEKNTGASDIVPGGLTATGEVSKSQSLITKSQFNNLQKYMDKIIKQISDEILSGNIEKKPYYNSKLNKGKTQCEYCNYKSICKFEPGINGGYSYIGTLNKDAIIDNISQQVE